MLIYKEGEFSAQSLIRELLNALAPPPISPTATLGIQSLPGSLQSTVFQNPGGCLLSLTDRLTHAGHTKNLVSNIGLMMKEILVDIMVTFKCLDQSLAKGLDRLNLHYHVQSNIQLKS